MSAQHLELAEIDPVLADLLDSLPAVKLLLDEIVVEGNRKTRRDIVLREMGLAVGDSLALSNVVFLLNRERRLLLNTGLFSEVQVLPGLLDIDAHTVTLRAVVRERWYFYPGVAFDLADRNFNVWWTEQNRSLDRINYGVKLKHSNVSGRADKLSLYTQGGYTQKVELKYERPYVNRAKDIGFEVGILVDRNREWQVNTVGGKPAFYGVDTTNVLRRRRYFLGVTIRPGIRLFHTFGLQRSINRVDSTLATDINPNFFGGGRTRQEFWGLTYKLILDRRDERPFPLRGDHLEFEAEKLGLGQRADINRFNVSLRYRRYLPFGKKLNLALEGKGKVDIERDQAPYFNLRGLGYSVDFLRGYQFYVVDGLDYGYLKSTLRAQVLNTTVHVPYAPIRRLEQVPLKVYVGTHLDVGGAYDPFDTPGNLLANRWLTSYGVGVYAVLFYGKVARVEMSRNDLGEWAPFVSYSLSF